MLSRRYSCQLLTLATLLPTLAIAAASTPIVLFKDGDMDDHNNTWSVISHYGQFSPESSSSTLLIPGPVCVGQLSCAHHREICWHFQAVWLPVLMELLIVGDSNDTPIFALIFTNPSHFSPGSLLLRSSPDNGTSWSPIRFLHGHTNVTGGYAAPLVDEKRGIVHMLYGRRFVEVWSISSQDR